MSSTSTSGSEGNVAVPTSSTEPTKPGVSSLNSLSNFLHALSSHSGTSPADVLPTLNANPVYSSISKSTQKIGSTANSLGGSNSSLSKMDGTGGHQSNAVNNKAYEDVMKQATETDLCKKPVLPPRPEDIPFTGGIGSATMPRFTTEAQPHSINKFGVGKTFHGFNQQISMPAMNMANSPTPSLINRSRQGLVTTPAALLQDRSIGLGQCFGCQQPVQSINDACQAMGNLFHTSCFTCCICQRPLKKKAFYKAGTRVFCEEDFLYSGFQQTAQRCYACDHPITDATLLAVGHDFHPTCFRCSRCNIALEDSPFTVDIHGDIYCLPDFDEVYAPRCCLCLKPISAVGLASAPHFAASSELGMSERIVYLDNDYHVNCFRERWPGVDIPTIAHAVGPLPGSKVGAKRAAKGTGHQSASVINVVSPAAAPNAYSALQFNHASQSNQSASFLNASTTSRMTADSGSQLMNQHQFVRASGMGATATKKSPLYYSPYQ